jgi:hypothetical protein
VSRILTILSTVFLILLTLVTLIGLVWANTLYARNHIGEKDFLIPWLAARSFLQYGNNPYNVITAERAQVIYYGNRASEDQDPLQLNIPFPVELFYFPFALIPDYAFSRGLWMTFLEIALVTLAILSLRLSGWIPARTLLPVILIFSVFWIYGFVPLDACSSVIFVALGIVGLLTALRAGRDELAGALLVVPLFKLDSTIFFMIMIIWWAIYHHRSRFLAGFMMTLTILVVFSLFILSSWFLPFLRGWISYINYNPGFSPGTIFASWWPVFGPRLGWVFSGFMFVILFIEWRSMLGKDFHHLIWTASLTLAATPLVGLPVAFPDYVLLFFPLIHFISILAERWSYPGRWGIPGLVLIFLFFILWLGNRGMLLTRTFIPSDITAFAFSFLLVLCLFWMRWWAVRPPTIWSKRLKIHGSVT